MLCNLNHFGPVRRKLLAIYLLSAVALSACQTTPPAEPEREQIPPMAETEPPQPKIDPIVLHQLLDLADAALARDELTYPEENSAYRYYQDILAMEPGQTDALRGLEHLVEQYVALALQALERNQPATARSMLSRARLILPNHASIEPTEAQIRLLSKAQRETLKMPQEKLNTMDVSLGDTLRAFAQWSNKADCRFVISAKNDAQGRWIYQQLASGVSETRVRAQINIRLPATVERLCFPV